MKKRIVRFLARRGWWRLAYRISPSLAGYYAATGAMEAMAAGLASAADCLNRVGNALKELQEKEK